MKKIERFSCIYKITDLTNNKIYIGRAKDFHERKLAHLRSAQPDKYSISSIRDSNMKIHTAMIEKGVENFIFDVVEKCNEKDLDRLEKFYINKYDCKYPKGYNMTDGGQTNITLYGENASQSKLTQEQVDDIYKRLLNGESVKNIQKIYSFISKSTITNINKGRNWKKEGYNYPLSIQKKAPVGEECSNSKITEKEVIEMREFYSKNDFKDVVKKYNNYKYDLIRSVCYGDSWKHLPIYKKKIKKWV